MPFGLVHAPNLRNTHESNIPTIFPKVHPSFSFLWLLIYTTNIGDHVQHLHLIFQILQETSNKCRLAQECLEKCFKRRADLEKLRATIEYPTPTNLRELRGFPKLTGYNQCFDANYGSLAAPLTQLLRIASNGRGRHKTHLTN